MHSIQYKPIGIIHSPFKGPVGVPIQSNAAKDILGALEVFPEFTSGLTGIEGFSHIIILYHFHLSKKFNLVIKPYMDSALHGVFSTRAPSRPNPIGLSVVRLLKRAGNTLKVRGIDVVDGTPLLDIKPYVPEFDVRAVNRIGWLEKNVKKLGVTRDDGRFS